MGRITLQVVAVWFLSCAAGASFAAEPEEKQHYEFEKRLEDGSVLRVTKERVPPAAVRLMKMAPEDPPPGQEAVMFRHDVILVADQTHEEKVVHTFLSSFIPSIPAYRQSAMVVLDADWQADHFIIVYKTDDTTRAVVADYPTHSKVLRITNGAVVAKDWEGLGVRTLAGKISGSLTNGTLAVTITQSSQDAPVVGRLLFMEAGDVYLWKPEEGTTRPIRTVTSGPPRGTTRPVTPRPVTIRPASRPS